MTRTRLPHSKAAPAFTGGTDRGAAPCVTPRGVETFDALTDLTGNTAPDPEYLAAARHMCATCVLRNPATADECLRGAVARGERWAALVLGRKVRNPTPETMTTAGRAAAGAHERRRAARLEELRTLIARGADVAEACRALGVTRDGLWKWCDKWGHGDIWRALNPRPATGNQYRKVDAIGEISLRRNRPSRAKGRAAA